MTQTSKPSTFPDEAQFSEQLKRMGKVTLAAGSLLPAFLSRRLNFTEDDTALAEGLKQALGTLKGPLMKIAQILGTVPDLLPEAYGEAFRELQSNAPPMGWPFVRRRMQGELGPDWESRFGGFSREATFAASLGQVHKATGLDGSALAVKLQYPEMASVVTSDLAQFRMLLSIYEKVSPALQTDALYAEIEARLLEELDYTQEAQNMDAFANMLAGEPEIHVPCPIPELSTPRLLTQTWLEGKPILSFQEAPQEFRNRLCRNLFHAWYVPLYHHGVLHGDPHLGNYTVTEEGHLNLLDFGCVRVFDPHFLKGVIALYRGLLNEDQDAIVAAYESWGFTTLSKEMIEILNQWAHFLYAPLLQDRVLGLEEVSTSRNGQKIAGEIHDKLKKLGGIRPPREFVFMDRAAVGLGSVFMRLGARLNWHQMFEDVIRGFKFTAFDRP